MRTTFLTLLISVFLLPVIHAQSIEGNYAIKNVKTGKLLRPEGANKADMTGIVLYPPTNWKCLTWQFIPMGKETYQLKNLFTSKTFYGTNQGSGDIILKQVPLEKNEPAQLWTFEKQDNGNYRIKLKGSELFVTPADESGRTNTAVVLTSKIDSDLQLWSIYEQDPEY